MMGNLNLYQFIVPLTFLAIWALTSLFNKEAQPLPPRVGRPPDPNGLNAQSSPPIRPVDRRPAPGGLDRPPMSRSALDNDGIIILDSEPRRPAAAVAGAPRPGAPRRTARTRTAAASPSKRAEVSTPRALSGTVAQSMTPLAQLSSGMKPLSQPQAPVPGADLQPTARTTAPPSQEPAPPVLTARNLGKLLGSPSRIRESFLVAELLQPPLSLRRWPRGPR